MTRKTTAQSSTTHEEVNALNAQVENAVKHPADVDPALWTVFIPRSTACADLDDAASQISQLYALRHIQDYSGPHPAELSHAPKWAIPDAARRRGGIVAAATLSVGDCRDQAFTRVISGS